MRKDGDRLILDRREQEIVGQRWITVTESEIGGIVARLVENAQMAEGWAGYTAASSSSPVDERVISQVRGGAKASRGLASALLEFLPPLLDEEISDFYEGCGRHDT